MRVKCMQGLITKVYRKSFFGTRIRYSSTKKENSFFRKNKEAIFGTTVVGGLSLYLYSEYKKNSCLNIEIYPSTPGTGIVVDEERISYLEGKFSKQINKAEPHNFISFYGKLGSGKSTLISEFCKKLDKNRNRYFIFPRSKVVAFIDCSSLSSFYYSLVEICSEISAQKKSPFNIFDSDNSTTPQKEIDILFEYISKTLSDHPNWIIVFDNLTYESFSNLKDTFDRFIFNNDFQKQKGTVFFVSDTREPIVSKESAFQISGLSLDAACKLFLKHSESDKNIFSGLNSKFSSLIDLMHSQPLSLISFALLMKNAVQNKSQSTDQAFKILEERLLERVKDRISNEILNLSPEHFETLLTESVLEIATTQSFNSCSDNSFINLSTIMSIFSPSIPFPETLLVKFLSNFNSKGPASCLEDIQPSPKFQTPNLDQSRLEKFTNIIKEGIEMFQYSREVLKNKHKFDDIESGIMINERLSTEYKKSPFINIKSKSTQDFLNVHPLFRNQVRSLYFDAISQNFQKLNESISSYIFNLFKPKNNFLLKQQWCLTKNPVSSLSSKQLNNFPYFSPDILDRFIPIDKLFQEVLNCLSHKDPNRMPSRKLLTLIRSQHLMSFFNELNDTFQSNQSFKISQSDMNYLSTLSNAMSSSLIDLGKHQLGRTMILENLKKMNDALDIQKNKETFVESYSILINSLLNQNLPKEALSYIQILWKLVAPNEAKSSPFLKAKAIFLVLKYNIISKKNLFDVENLDLACHALLNFYQALSEFMLPVDQIANDLMELYIIYGNELIQYGYIDYASALVSKADNFNRDIFKNKNPTKHSPFDKKLFDLKFYLESIKGNITITRNMKM